jgi:CRP/FNR family transcriptional regulator, cyclic AMP receptor protein
MAQEHVALLQRMSLCQALSAQELVAIAAIVSTRSVEAGGELFREGDAGDGLYLVVDGEISVVKRGTSGEHVLAKLGPGGVLGEMSLITADARSATGRAITATGVLHLPSGEFRALMDAGSVAALKITAAVADVLARRVATMNMLVLGLAGGEPAAGTARTPMKTQDLAELHRTMHVWSF